MGLAGCQVRQGCLIVLCSECADELVCFIVGTCIGAPDAGMQQVLIALVWARCVLAAAGQLQDCPTACASQFALLTD